MKPAEKAHMKFIAATLVMFMLAADASAGIRIDIELSQPESFLDLKMPDATSAESQAQFVSVIEKELARLLESRVSGDYELRIVFEQVDLAGRITAPLGMPQQDIRVVDDMAPARLEFSYRLTRPGNILIRQGNEDLRDYVRPTDAYGRGRNRQLHVERRMMAEWLKRVIIPAATP